MKYVALLGMLVLAGHLHNLGRPSERDHECRHAVCSGLPDREYTKCQRQIWEECRR